LIYFPQERHRIASSFKKNPNGQIQVLAQTTRGRAPTMAWTRLIQSARAALGTAQSCSTLGLPRFHSSKPATYFGACSLFIWICLFLCISSAFREI